MYIYNIFYVKDYVSNIVTTVIEYSNIITILETCLCSQSSIFFIVTTSGQSIFIHFICYAYVAHKLVSRMLFILVYFIFIMRIFFDSRPMIQAGCHLVRFLTNADDDGIKLLNMLVQNIVLYIMNVSSSLSLSTLKGLRK